MRPYFLGIDGGGTKTVFVLCDSRGDIQAEHHAGSADYRQIGIEGMKKLLTDGIKALNGELEKKCPPVLTDAGETADLADMLEGVCFGVPNYTEIAGMDALINAMVCSLFPGERTLLVNDSEVGWAGSLAMEPGINLVSGTGSISFGRNEEGKTATVGGWSDFFSDEGSCHWLGMKCLELFSKEADGRIPKGALYQIVRDHFYLQDDKDIIQVVDTTYRPHRADIASLQRLLAEAARKGDSFAREAYVQAADELILIAKATVQALGMKEDVKVSCSGGLFNRRSPVLPIMKQKLKENHMIWVRPQFPPHLGAVLLAADHTGNTGVAEQMKGKWKNVYNRT